jgi:hypothetical protein
MEHTSETRTETLTLSYEEAALLSHVLIAAHARAYHSPAHDNEEKRVRMDYLTRLTSLNKRITHAKLALIQRMPDHEASVKLSEPD